MPLLLFACEVWGYENIDFIKRAQIKYLKHILNLKSCTPSYMLYGETKRFPLYIFTRMVLFWANIINDKGEIPNPWIHF